VKDYPRLVFYGTPGFAVASLERLVAGGFHVVAVVTAPDKPAGRGLDLHESAVKKFALASGLPVLQPVNMRDPAFIRQLKSLKPDLQIVIAFRMMPEAVWSLPPLGTFNLHASLLPQYRGAAPINHAIMNGETVTGVTTFFLNEKIDEGRILFTERVPIGAEETAGELHDRLMEIGAGLVVRTVKQIERGDAGDTPQDAFMHDGIVLKPAPKIFKEDCRINWNEETRKVHNLIRGLSPHPGAFCEVPTPEGGLQTMKIFRAVPELVKPAMAPGSFVLDPKTTLKVATNDGFIYPTQVQLSGRKPMAIADFLRGYASLFL
jgi:methionyl-tRNA formyltransferase